MITTITMVEPRSGISRMTPIGTAARPSAWTMALPCGYGCSPASTRADSSVAMPRMIAILQNSDGCTEKPPPSTIQECAPLTVEPSGLSTASTASTAKP